MKYQVLSITLASHYSQAKGNPIYLTNPFEMSADSIHDLGQKVADMLFELGIGIAGIGAVYRGDIEQQWEREPEKPNLFNGDGEEHALPKKRKPREKKSPLITAANMILATLDE